MKRTADPTRRLLMTADTVGGVWNFAIALCRELQDMEILLATMGRAPSECQRAQAAALPNLSLRSGDFRLEWMEDPWEDVDRAGDWLMELAAEFNPDLVHLNGYTHATLPFAAPVLVTAHSCVLSWWRAIRATPPPAIWDEYARRVGAGLAAAAMVTAPTASMMREIHRHYGPPRHSRVIYNGIAAAASTADHEKEPMYLSVGRIWDEGKNIHAVADIAASLPWPVALAGESGTEDWHRFANLQPLGQLPTDELEKWYHKAAVYVHPARYEPFGLAVLEAALARCALVLSDISTLREIWGPAAVYVDPRDPAVLRQTLIELATDPPARQALGRRAALRAREFTAARMASGYRDAYRDLLAPLPALS